MTSNNFIFYILLFISFSGCQQETHFYPWEFRQAGTDKWLPATVPGTIHTDLIDNELIPDPFVGTNELKVQWVEEKDWEYRTSFRVASNLLNKKNVDLIFEGLDTYANVFVNDSLVIRSNNMHTSWSAEIRKLLRKGDNQLRVYFKSPVREGQQKLKELDYFIPASNEAKPIGQQNSIFSRKAQYHYGWDWGPRLVTSGIWRDVKIKGWNGARIENVRIDTRAVSEEMATCYITIFIENKEAAALSANIDFQNTPETIKLIAQNQERLDYEVQIPNPKLWWPNGLGTAHLYDLKIDLLANGKQTDLYEDKTGIRYVEFMLEKEDAGSSFYFKINGLPVFMKGANYIPADFFNTRATKKYERVIQNAVDANMNMLRVWGGAVYENEKFYDLCDENGILIWQDFMFACSMVPTQQHHFDAVKREAKAVVSRLSHHPSIVLWCGNNENLSGWKKWGWQDSYNLHGPDSAQVWQAYDTLFNHILPGYVELYGNGNYWGTSPSSGVNQLENKHSGDQHEWAVWFGQKSFDQFEDNAGRFISEYGLQSFPGMETIRKFDASVKEWTMDTEALRFRQRSKMPWIAEGFDGFDMMKHYIMLYYNAPENLEEMVYLSQLTQALGLQTAIEAHRRNKPYTMGSLYWQIDDVWPTISWSTVDYSGNWKAAHYAVREANKPVIISAAVQEEQLKVHVISDKKQYIYGVATLLLKKTNNEVISQKEIEFELNPLVNEIIFKEPLDTFLKGNLKNKVWLEMELRTGSHIVDQAIYYFVPPKELQVLKPTIQTIIEGTKVTLKSDHLARGIHLSTKNLRGHFSDNYFDLLPGKSKTVSFTGEDTEVDLKEELLVTSLEIFAEN